MTAWAPADFEAKEDQDADQITASPLTLQREHLDGKATAWWMTERSAENGRSADSIQQRHAELSGPTADQTERTPAESSWWSGYRSGAEGSTDLLREMEDREAGE